VERFSFAPEAAFVPRGDLLDRVSVAPLTAPFEEGAIVQAAIFRFEPGGRLRRHPAGSPQILAVLEGSGEVSGARRVVSMSRSAQAKAVFFARG
jgi:quercetin dioxygenase-like cupin family protein